MHDIVIAYILFYITRRNFQNDLTKNILFFQNRRLLVHWASLGGHDTIVSHLLELGSPVDPVDDSGATPLILSSAAGKNIVARILVSRGANVNHKNDQGHSALQYACSKGRKEVLYNI